MRADASLGSTMSTGALREQLLVGLLATLPLLPFLNAAVSIDAPVFVAVAEQIAAHPLDPYGFELIWDPTSPRVSEFNHNPPLLSYWLAPVIAALGRAEWAMHAALLPFPLIAALCFLGIARRLAGAGAGPAVLFVCTPAFLLLATTLLLDVPVLAAMLLSVYALLRANEGGGARWECLAGLAAAAAGLTKYVGFAVVPLLAAGVWLLPGKAPATAARWLRIVGLPLACLALWGAITHALYGTVHFAGGVALVGGKSFAPWEFWNRALSVPVYYGAALGFPVLVLFSRLARGRGGTELAVAGVVAGAVVMGFVLPEGTPERRVGLDLAEAVFGALAFAGAVQVWGEGAARAARAASPEDHFLLLWLGGLLGFSALVNWHVNAADALMAAPPALLLLFRHDTRPSPRATGAFAAVLLALSLLVTASDVRQRDVYREAAGELRRQIGELPGARWSVGQWGFQYYLEAEGFRPVLPPQYRGRFGQSELAPGDWVATARNVSQLDVKGIMARYPLTPVRVWRWEARLPLRATNPDAGGGFYSHQSGFVPISWSWAPLEEIGLARLGRGP
jgi:4-amino-4-deoxy-L-arabinose transferase-like glycosyltransferase